MKRLERLGSAAFLTITLSLVFHLLAMSYDSMLKHECINCDQTNPLIKWDTSLLQRCYEAPVQDIFSSYARNDSVVIQTSSLVKLCIPNQYLMVKESKYAYNCLMDNINYPHVACPLGNYDKKYCKCDYSTRTKLALATSILSALILGAMLFLSHLVSFVKIDYILRWLIPLCFILLVINVLLMIITLGATASKLDEDVDEIAYSYSLFEEALHNNTLINQLQQVMKSNVNLRFKSKIGWCFGMEILSLYFTVVSIVLYALMFTAKKRPEHPLPR